MCIIEEELSDDFDLRSSMEIRVFFLYLLRIVHAEVSPLAMQYVFSLSLLFFSSFSLSLSVLTGNVLCAGICGRTLRPSSSCLLTFRCVHSLSYTHTYTYIHTYKQAIKSYTKRQFLGSFTSGILTLTSALKGASVLCCLFPSALHTYTESSVDRQQRQLTHCTRMLERTFFSVPMCPIASAQYVIHTHIHTYTHMCRYGLSLSQLAALKKGKESEGLSTTTAHIPFFCLFSSVQVYINWHMSVSTVLRKVRLCLSL